MVLQYDHTSVTVKGHDLRGALHLDTKEIIPPFSEVTGEVPSRLSNDLHPNVVPRHPRDPAPVIHILLGFIQSVEVSDPTVAIILACDVYCLTNSECVTKIRGLTRPDLLASFEIQRIGVIDENVLWCVPPAETHIEPTHERDGLVDNTQFLMLTKKTVRRCARDGPGGMSYVGPVECSCLEVTGGTLNHNILRV